MDNFNTSSFDIYKDISARTKGEIYIGVIGAVRTGKSTFIKRHARLSARAAETLPPIPL